MVTPQGKDTSTFKNITEEKKKEPDFEKIKNFQRKFKENTSTAQKKDIEKE